MVHANESPLDRALRVVAGIGMLGLGWAAFGDGLPAVACQILGWYPLVTGLLGWSPLYAVLGCSTLRDRA